MVGLEGGRLRSRSFLCRSCLGFSSSAARCSSGRDSTELIC